MAQFSEPARETARLTATMGRSFSLELRIQASPTDTDSLAAALDKLWERQIVRGRGTTR